jgi:SPP1 gp7 family putative phage head morphogenesis protein
VNAGFQPGPISGGRKAVSGASVTGGFGGATPPLAPAGFSDPAPPKPVSVKNARLKAALDGSAATDAVSDAAIGSDPFQGFRDGIKKALGENRPPEAKDLPPLQVASALHASMMAAYLNAVESVLLDLRATSKLGPVPKGVLPGKTFAEFAETGFSFEPLTPEEASAWWQSRTALPYSEYRRLDESVKARAFSLAQAQSEEIAAKVQGLVAAALADPAGGMATPAAFLKEINALFERAGIGPIHRRQAETVFLTNLHTAYNAGRWRMYNRAGMRAVYDRYEYKTAGDDHVRPAHEALNGIVRAADDDFWRSYWPPNGYRCRCTVVAISIYEDATVTPDGRLNGITNIYQPDEGFGGNPGASFASVA